MCDCAASSDLRQQTSFPSTGVPCEPFNVPCDPAGPCVEPPKCYTLSELENLPQCPPRVPPPPTKSITIQQPPRLICKKNVIFVKKIIQEPQVVQRCKSVVIPKVVETTRVIQVPKLTWISQMVREPRVLYYSSMVPDPYVVCCPRVICEPKEICTTMLCKPKPQVIDVPPPPEYCCYTTGPIGLKENPPCSPSPVEYYNPCVQWGQNPCGNDSYNPCTGFSYCSRNLCGPCSPCISYKPIISAKPCIPCNPDICGGQSFQSYNPSNFYNSSNSCVPTNMYNTCPPSACTTCPSPCFPCDDCGPSSVVGCTPPCSPVQC